MGSASSAREVSKIGLRKKRYFLAIAKIRPEGSRRMPRSGGQSRIVPGETKRIQDSFSCLIKKWRGTGSPSPNSGGAEGDGGQPQRAKKKVTFVWKVGGWANGNSEGVLEGKEKVPKGIEKGSNLLLE